MNAIQLLYTAVSCTAVCVRAHPQTWKRTQLYERKILETLRGTKYCPAYIDDHLAAPSVTVLSFVHGFVRRSKSRPSRSNPSPRLTAPAAQSHAFKSPPRLLARLSSCPTSPHNVLNEDFLPCHDSCCDCRHIYI